MDAAMTQAALKEFDTEDLDLIFLENVGNLVCTAEQDTGANINIEILNGTSVGGLANRTSMTYRSYGYNVTAVGNADSGDVEETFIIGHKNDISIIERVAGVIKCRNISTENGTEGSITIILGKDFDGRQCK